MSDFTVVQLLNQPTPVIITGGYVPRGAYAAGTDYAVGDSVDYLGSSYVMYVDAAAGTLPTDTTKWQIIANKGATGSAGADGADGADGAAATIAVGTVTTVDPSDPATVTNSGTSAVAVFDFEIPKGDPGTSGHVIKDEGTPLTARAGLNFVGAGVTATDDAGNDQTIVTIPSTDITGKASLALDNLASVAINTSLISDTDSTDDLGSTTKQWANVHTDRLVSTISDLVIENDLSDGDITFKVNDGGVDKTVMTLDGATGNVGIGTTSPLARLGVIGADSLGTSFAANISGATGTGLVVTNAGNVGIGTTSPARKLSVSVPETDSWVASIGSSTSDGGRIMLGTMPGGKAAIGAHNYLENGWTDLILQVQGNVGIGNVTPLSKLGLKGNASIGATYGAVAAPASGMIIEGNVGIGTTSPSQKLHVVGNSFIDGSIGIGTVNPTYKLHVAGTTTAARMIIEATDATYNSEINLKTVGGGTWAIYNKDSNGSMNFYNSGDKLTLLSGGNVGIGTTSPTNILSLGGNSARTFWLERHTTANTAGNTLTVTAGGATSGATDKAGGDLILTPGLSTGTGESGVQIKGVPAGSTGTTDGTQTLMIQVLGNKLSFYNQTPVVRPTALTPTGTYVLNTGDAGSDTEITLMRTRINELESKLQGLGLLT